MSKIPRNGLASGPDHRLRCFWGVSAPDYVAYHDREWGFPVADDRRLFEKLCLEGFQSGLSWLTILRKREAFRAAFAGFDATAVARFTARDVTRLLGDAGIVRHRGKIESTINNAKRVLELVEEHGSLARYVWTFVPPASERPRSMTRAALMKLATTPTSVRLSKDLKRRGWTYVGPTTVYAFMQAMGLVDDHLEGCVIRPAAEAARAAFSRPFTGFRLTNYRRPLEAVTKLTASDKKQLKKLLADEGTTIAEAVTSDEPITMELVDVMEGDKARYQLYLWSFGCGALLEAGTTNIVANVIQHSFQMLDDDPAISEAIAVACKRDSKKLEIEEEIGSFDPGTKVPR